MKDKEKSRDMAMKGKQRGKERGGEEGQKGCLICSNAVRADL